MVLPEITVEWLDTVTGEAKTATLPAETIRVAGTAPAPVAQDAPAATVTPQATQSDRSWLWGMIAGGALLIGGAGAFVFAQRSKQPAPAPVRQKDDVLRDLRTCARTGVRKAFYTALLELRTHSDASETPRIDAALAELERETYAAKESAVPADLPALLKRLAVRPQRSRTFWPWTRRDTLPSLYPQT